MCVRRLQEGQEGQSVGNPWSEEEFQTDSSFNGQEQSGKSHWCGERILSGPVQLILNLVVCMVHNRCRGGENVCVCGVVVVWGGERKRQAASAWMDDYDD